MSRRRPGKMGSDDVHGLVAVALDELPARFRGHRWVGIELAYPFRMGDLDRMVDHVTRNHRVLAAGRDTHAGVTRRMTRGGLEPNFAGEPVSRLDQLGESGFDNRTH